MNSNATTTTTFQTGTTYYTRSIGDHNCIYEITVASRTAKRLVTTDGKILGIKVYDGCEFVMPMGRYSMAPRIRANKTERPRCDWEQNRQTVEMPAVSMAELVASNGGCSKCSGALSHLFHSQG